MPYDICGSAYTAVLRVVSGFREVWARTRSEDSGVDIRTLAFQTDTEILHCQHEAVIGFELPGDAGGWSLQTVSRTQPHNFNDSSFTERVPQRVHRLVSHEPSFGDRAEHWTSYFNYNRLAVLSLSFHWCFGKGLLALGDETVTRVSGCSKAQPMAMLMTFLVLRSRDEYHSCSP